MAGVTASRTQETLRSGLEALVRATRYVSRMEADPVGLPHRYSAPRDIEVSGLLAATLAYGRVELFRPKVEALLEAMGPSPARFVERLEVAQAERLLRGFVYRFNVGSDVAVLLLGMGATLRARGSLEALFSEQLSEAGSLQGALAGFGAQLRAAGRLDEVQRVLGPERGLAHLLPTKVGSGAAKRLNLYLRWMVRGPDAVDFGIWKSISPSLLVIPLDTHIARLSRLLGFTRRKSLGWSTAEEISAALRRVDPLDPVRFDFALCHHGMSGGCPVRPSAAACGACPLAAVCSRGRRLTAK